MTVFAAIFEGGGRALAYALVAPKPEAAFALLAEPLWPEAADKARIVDDQGRTQIELARSSRRVVSFRLRRRSDLLADVHA